MAAPDDILPPRYRSPQRIGSGGMGEIYRALDSTLGRAVAVKVLAAEYASDEHIRARFVREGLAAARLSGDPHTVTIFDVGEWQGRPFIVMEELAGGSLEQRLRRGRPSSGQALEWLAQAASALDAAHRSGVVHRDVKPGNLLLDGEDVLYVADFGIASAAGMTSLTVAGTAASDRYALAVVAYELLTGALPEDPPRPVAGLDPALPGTLDAVFARALAAEPQRRPASAAELVADLRGAFDSAEAWTRVAAPAPAATVARRPSRRNRLPLVLGLLAAAAAGAIVAALVATSGGDGNAAASQSVSVRTVTGRSETVVRTVTAERTTTLQVTASEPPSGDGHALNDQGYARLQAGDAAGALPLLEEAVRQLEGAGPGDPYEGYASYNAGIALLDLGRCPEARPYLERAKHLEKGRHEPAEALKRVKKCELS